MEAMKKQNLFFSMMLFLSLQNQEVSATTQQTVWKQRPDGWHFYKPNPLVDETTKDQKPSPSSPSAPAAKAPESYKKQLEKWQERFEEAKAKAVLHPTAPNIEEVQKLQRYLTDQSLTFSEKWMEVTLKKGVLTYPEANGSPQYREVRKAEQKKRIEFLMSLARLKDFGFFFLTKEGCSYCEKFAPTVKEYAKEHNLSVLEIYEGAATGLFSSQPDNGIGVSLNEEGIYPMLYLVDPKNKHFHPVSRGLSAKETLTQNMQMVLEELHKEGAL
jgi:conjugal transfer pilus assembly protein TraF